MFPILQSQIKMQKKYLQHVLVGDFNSPVYSPDYIKYKEYKAKTGPITNK
jgi:endonuclease/exonuclease/phosphatase family metal-dependent hydrolase